MTTSFAVSPSPASALDRETGSDWGFALAGPPLDGKTRCPGHRSQDRVARAHLPLSFTSS